MCTLFSAKTVEEAYASVLEHAGRTKSETPKTPLCLGNAEAKLNRFVAQMSDLFEKEYDVLYCDDDTHPLDAVPASSIMVAAKMVIYETSDDGEEEGEAYEELVSPLHIVYKGLRYRSILIRDDEDPEQEVHDVCIEGIDATDQTLGEFRRVVIPFKNAVVTAYP